MRLQTCFLALATMWSVSVEAHSLFTSMFVNGESVGDGTCVRIDKNATTSFVEDITSDQMSCGITGLPKVDRTCPIKAGDVISFQWRSRPGSSNPEVIVASHNGTCGVYMKQMSTGDPAPDGSFPNDSPAGDGWFKVLYDDKDSSGRWCIDRLRTTAAGVISIKIPNDIKTGYYLLRPELLALHQAKDGQPQFYVGCAQVYITGGTGTANPETVAIPGYVNMSMPAMTFNIFDPKAGPFPGFGPALYKGGDARAAVPSPIETAASMPPSSKVLATSTVSSEVYTSTNNVATSSTAISIPAISTFSTIVLPSASAVAAKPVPTTSSCHDRKAKRRADIAHKQIEYRETTSNPFACPANTVLEIGNLCLPEVPSWSDTDDSMKNCWASSKKCWETNDLCWNQTNSAVDSHSGHGCYLYSYKCSAVQKSCERKKMQGPADAGQVLTEVKQTLGGWGIMS